MSSRDVQEKLITDKSLSPFERLFALAGAAPMGPEGILPAGEELTPGQSAERLYSTTPGTGILSELLGYQPRFDDKTGSVAEMEKTPGLIGHLLGGRWSEAGKSALRLAPDVVGAGVAVKALGAARPSRGLLNALSEGPSVDDQIAKGLKHIESLKANQTDIPAAMTHPELGPITFRWGTKKGGFHHIFSKHGDDIGNGVPEAIVRGDLGEPYKTVGGMDRRDISFGDRRVVLSPDFHGDPDQWVVTSFKVIDENK